MSDPLDILVIAAHPDDAELTVGGTIIKSIKQGLRVGVLDLTQGELGSRGTVELRSKEATDAAAVLGLSVRENLCLPDGNITSDGLMPLIHVLRRWCPKTVMTHPSECRHPDHEAAHHLVRKACFYAGLPKLTSSSGAPPWRPQHVLFFAEMRLFEPSFVVDVSGEWSQRIRALQCYVSQFDSLEYKLKSSEPETFISTSGFMEWVEARARTYGHLIGCTYGEPFQYHGTLGVSDLDQFLHSEVVFQ